MKKFVFAAAVGGAAAFSAIPASAQLVFVDDSALSICAIDAATCSAVVDNYLAVLNSGSLTDDEYRTNLALLISYLIQDYGSTPGQGANIAAQIDKVAALPRLNADTVAALNGVASDMRAGRPVSTSIDPVLRASNS